MKKVLKNVSFVILLLKMCFIFGQELATQKRVVIDVGHGGKDSGAIGVNGILEKDVVMDIANEILKRNNNLNKPLDIYLTRYNDTLISLSDRTKLAKALKADLFISLHCNYSDNPKARGIEIYVSNDESNHSNNSTWFAFQLQAGFNKKLGFESRGVKFANFQVIRESCNFFPAILVELGFFSNKDELKYISEPLNKQSIASAILIEVINYLKDEL
ncbi:N-acetylmuramoyl-L-alanine amidase [Salegentibacter sp. F188]|uniref:N-acetylmuramoyl-L-alanine amidase n=2 Tax=Autumnicola TaxID=3160927 RepID=A0ABU3E733_9FLAO|nr:MULTISPECIES: N-acetylmuramoyl-L-alanine amidase [Flavobacteriaceae]MDT0687352.1 N-acetylmuramoyl-L-alanine amidase [Zunongwangia sp. F225]MDT0691809.1 N-acetylmuramoyl-L-alanine amidase [Salegentibacter sp. F188]